MEVLLCCGAQMQRPQCHSATVPPPCHTVTTLTCAHALALRTLALTQQHGGCPIASPPALVESAHSDVAAQEHTHTHAHVLAPPGVPLPGRGRLRRGVPVQVGQRGCGGQVPESGAHHGRRRGHDSGRGRLQQLLQRRGEGGSWAEVFLGARPAPPGLRVGTCARAHIHTHTDTNTHTHNYIHTRTHMHIGTI